MGTSVFDLTRGYCGSDRRTRGSSKRGVRKSAISTSNRGFLALRQGQGRQDSNLQPPVLKTSMGFGANPHES
jgi:hypothetical protein